MINKTFTQRLPDGFVVCDDYNLLFRLMKGKRVFKEGNIERDDGQTIYIYSEASNGFYKRTLSPFMGKEDVEKYIKRRILYFKLNK